MSGIDFTLARLPLRKWLLLGYNYPTGSEHDDIEWEVETDMQEDTDHKRVLKPNLTAMVEKDAEAAEKLWV